MASLSLNAWLCKHRRRYCAKVWCTSRNEVILYIRAWYELNRNYSVTPNRKPHGTININWMNCCNTFDDRNFQRKKTILKWKSEWERNFRMHKIVDCKCVEDEKKWILKNWVKHHRVFKKADARIVNPCHFHRYRRLITTGKIHVLIRYISIPCAEESMFLE